MARSLNRVELIGNLTRDPELRYTPQGTAVCTFGVATNRSWTTDTGEKKEDSEFHKIVAWNKLGELCSQLLTKGRKVYVEGRLANRSWTGQDGTQKTTTEIVISDMLILDSRKETVKEDGAEENQETPVVEAQSEDAKPVKKEVASKAK
jgi:single-strand DNA-binding protein